MLKKVYISSTYKDLTVYRNAIRDMFLSKGLQDEYTLVGMEGYVSENGKKAIEVCLEDVREADIYILILAKRYGSIVEGTNISYTETEYNEAVTKAGNNPLYKIFVFYSSEEIEKEDFAAAPALENPALESFYAKALKNHASFIYPFTTPDNLCKQLLLTFCYNFKKPDSISDYKEALMLIDRNVQSYNFSKSFKKNSNSFYFTSANENSPVDFVERLYDFEMAGKYRPCSIEMSQFITINADKFKESFIAQLTAQWAKDMSEYKFEKDDQLFLSIEINSMQVTSTGNIENLQKVLLEFLPKYLADDGGLVNKNRVFFIFYKDLDGTGQGIEIFNAVIKNMLTVLQLPNCLTEINALSDLTRTDTRIWLNNFVKIHKFDEDDIDDLLEVSDKPYKTEFKMKEVKKAIKKWLEKNVFNNS